MGNAASKIVQMKDTRAGEIVDQLSKSVGSMTDQFTDSLSSWGSKAKVKAKVAARTTEGLVRASPWQAVGVIALVGLAAGVLLSYGTRSRRRRSSSEPTDNQDEMAGG